MFDDTLKPIIHTERQTPIEIALQIDADGNTTSKSLYEFLELNPAHYSRWVKTNIEDNPYAEEGLDYWVFTTNGENPLGGRPSTNYKLTADFAKKLAMVSGSPKGEEARDYFVSVEQNAKKLANSTDRLGQLINNDPIIALRYQQIQMEQRLDYVEEHTSEARRNAALAAEKANLAHVRIDSLDAIDPNGTPRQRLVALVNKYAQHNGLQFNEAWGDFRKAFNTAFRTNLKLKMQYYAATREIKNLTVPAYLEATGQIEDGLRIASKMLGRKGREI